MKNIQKEYWEKYNKYCKNEISETEWIMYCMGTLKDLMILNKEVLDNLK